MAKARKKMPAAFRARAEAAKKMTPAQRAAWAKKMQAARVAAAKRKSKKKPAKANPPKPKKTKAVAKTNPPAKSPPFAIAFSRGRGGSRWVAVKNGMPIAVLGTAPRTALATLIGRWPGALPVRAQDPRNWKAKGQRWELSAA